MRAARLAAALAAAALAGACSSPAPRPPTDTPQPRVVAPETNAGRYAMKDDAYPEPGEVPPDIALIPDAVPRAEPRSRGGNAPVYEVFGKTYRVLEDARGFSERGGASWYGKKFHGHKTANGEIYDMYRMTAAHKSLPLPSYVRVTRLDNGRSVVVRVNDRGPFHRGRIIDLSYAAAAKLDMIQVGAAEVEIAVLEPVEPGVPTMVASTAPAPAEISVQPAPGRWLQLGVYADPINAVAMREELSRSGHAGAQILVDEADGIPVHRVVLGPYAENSQAQALHARLQAAGYTPTWVEP